MQSVQPEVLQRIYRIEEGANVPNVRVGERMIWRDTSTGKVYLLVVFQDGSRYRTELEAF